MCNPTSLFCLFSWQFYCKIFKIFETPSWLKPEQLYRSIKLPGSLRNMSKVLRCEGLKHSCAFLIETGPAQTTPIPQTLMLFSVILLNRSWGSWAHKLPPCLSPLKAKNLYPLGCTVWVSHPRNTVTSHSLNTNIVHWILGPMFSQEYQSNNHLTFTVIWGNRGGLKWFLLSYYLV